MRPKSLILLALALGCGLIASIGISQVLENRGKPAAVETTPIYVALRNVNVGDPVDDKMVSLEEWPRDKVPVGAITKWDDLANRRPRTNIYQGEPILDGKLLAKGQTNDPIQGVPSGMRLKTISVDARKSAAGLLSPGDRVDMQIFVHRDAQNGIDLPFTKIFLQNIRVYAIDQTIEKSADGTESRTVAKTVSLIVTPAQANRITLAENLGEVSLIPRHPDDETVVDDSAQSADDLMSASTAGSRSKEQLGSTKKESGDSGPLSGLKALMAQAMARAAAQAAQSATVQVAAAPPFQMTIIYPTEVDHIQFTDSGEPVTSGDKASAPGPAAQNPLIPASTPNAAPAAPAPPPTAADGAGAAADFPIDFKNK